MEEEKNAETWKILGRKLSGVFQELKATMLTNNRTYEAFKIDQPNICHLGFR